VCNTRYDKTFFLHDSTRPILGMSTQSVPRHCTNTLPKANYRRLTLPQQTKNKKDNKKFYRTHITQQESMGHCKQQVDKTRMRDSRRIVVLR
jgi:hypothetical protein